MKFNDGLDFIERVGDDNYNLGIYSQLLSFFNKNIKTKKLKENNSITKNNTLSLKISAKKIFKEYGYLVP